MLKISNNMPQLEIKKIIEFKAAELSSNLGRADALFKDNELEFIQYIASLRPLACCIGMEVMNTLPEWRRDILSFIKSGYSVGAYRRWKNRSVYWNQWKN